MDDLLDLAIVTETYPPEVNGVARTIAVMVHGLVERGHKVSLYRPKQPGESVIDGLPNFKTKLLPGLVLPFYPEVRMGWPRYRFFLKTWKKNPPELVHVVTEGPLGWAAVRAANRLKLPVVSDFHTNFHTYSRYYKMGLGQKLVSSYLRNLHNRTLCTMVPTLSLKHAMEKNGYQRLSVVGRGVDTKLFDPKRRHTALRESWQVAPEDPVCLYVGRLAAEKNLSIVAEAFKAFSALNPKAKLVLVGDGPMRNKLRQMFPSAIFAGVRRGESLARYYASADIFLFPSLSETFGNVVMEAMASGLAVLAFNDAAAGTYIKSGETGMLVEPENIAGFAQAAGRLAEMPEAWRSWGGAARNVAVNCTWENVVDDLLKVFTESLSLKGAYPCKAIV